MDLVNDNDGGERGGSEGDCGEGGSVRKGGGCGNCPDALAITHTLYIYRYQLISHTHTHTHIYVYIYTHSHTHSHIYTLHSVKHIQLSRTHTYEYAETNAHIHTMIMDVSRKKPA